MIPGSVGCLAFNSERTVRKTLDSVRQISDEINIVDFYSTNDTIEFVKESRTRLILTLSVSRRADEPRLGTVLL